MDNRSVSPASPATAFPVLPPGRGTFREAYRRWTDAGLRPRVVAGILILWRLRFTQGQLPENRPPTEREMFDDTETKLREIFFEAPHELREAQLVPLALVPEESAWEHFLKSCGGWLHWFQHEIRPPYDPQRAPDPEVEEARALWSHAIRCSEDAGIVALKACRVRLQKGLLRAKCVPFTIEEALAEWQVITRSPHRTLFRWKRGRLELSDWRVRDATPGRAPRRRPPKARQDRPGDARPDSAPLCREIDMASFARGIQTQREERRSAPADSAALEYLLADLRFVGVRLAGGGRLRRRRLTEVVRKLALAVAGVIGSVAPVLRESRAAVARRYGVSVKALRYREPSVRKALVELVATV